MLENLVGNSIEHGPEDVAIRVREFESGFYYEDSGPGIDPEHRDRVFTPGFSTKNGEEGIGMGMASVRQIVLAHGWDIQIKDGEYLDGVRFEITDS
jgi:signal transduction histidine kinase